jgi:hypothetical protein
VLLFSIGGCISFPHEDAHYFYPTDLGGGGEQLYAWPGGRPGEFRFFVQLAGNGLGDSSAQAESLHAIRDRERIDALAANASSLTILLPADADPRVRQDALTLIERLSNARPELSTHCVAIRSDVRTVESGAGLQRVLTREGSFHEESRPTGFWASFSGFMGQVWSMAETPNFVVVPLDSGPDRFAVYGDLRVQGEAATVVECGADEVAGILQARLLDPDARKLAGSWRSMDRGDEQTIAVSWIANVYIDVFMPHDTPAERRAQCESLATRLCTAELAPIVIAQADTSWDWAACTSGEFVRKKLPLDGDKSFIAGPVRQSAVLPKPEKLLPKPVK